ncbi:ABC transporter permease [Candidatus Sumerlaeota bacterium]|nr:ABC transporter permease [Candidatus Sumerlaeota bacterium]
MGFVIASLVPTARFAQLIAGTVLYPLLAISGLFASTESFPPALAFVSNLSPLTHAVSLTAGIWEGESWSNFGVELLALTATFCLCMMLSSKVFRWE